MTRIRFYGAMHPRRAIRFPRTERTARERRRVAQLRGALLAIFLGTALAAVLFLGWSGGFRP